MDGLCWQTTPFDIANQISKGLADNVVVAKVGVAFVLQVIFPWQQVNGEVFDLDRPLEGDCQLELLKFDNEEGIDI